MLDFNDFLILNFFKTKNKIRKIREMINRLFFIFSDLLLQRIASLEVMVQHIYDDIEDGDGDGSPPDKPDPPIPPPDYPQDPDDDDDEIDEDDLPDLVTIDMFVAEVYDHYTLVKGIIENIGNSKAGRSFEQGTAYYEDNGDWAEIGSIQLLVPELEAGETVTVYHTITYSPTGDPQSFKITQAVDVTDMVEEKNEDNNFASITFTGKQPYEIDDPPPAGKSYLIYHIHNPEGIEINSISGIGLSAYLEIPGYGTPLYGAHNTATHCSPLELPKGQWTVIAHFNGMAQTQTINLEEREVEQIIFTFDRKEVTSEIYDTYSFDYADSFLNPHSYVTGWHNNTIWFSDSTGYFRPYYRGKGTYRIDGTYTRILNAGYAYQQVVGEMWNEAGDCDDPIFGCFGYMRHNVGGTQSQPWIYLTWGFDINILATDKWNDWYIQHGDSSNYFTMNFTTYPTIEISHQDYSGNYLDTVVASNNYTHVDVTDGVVLSDGNADMNGDPFNWISNGRCEDLHISNVPFDIDDLGVKG